MRRIFLSLGVLAFGFVAAINGAAAQDRVKAGTLVCDVSGGLGMIIGSKKGVQCLFNPSLAGPVEGYVGTISKFGLDIGATTGGEMVWSVFAPSSKRGHFGLAGDYSGASAQATVGAGAGANVLVGGSDKTITLQPLSLQAQTGLNLVVGVAGLTLRPAER